MTSREWLEEQYRPWKAENPAIDVNAIVTRWQRMSASYLARADVVRNVPYGTRPEERLDFLKPSEPDAPVLLFIHGGYWQSLDKDDYAFALEPFVSAGALVASVNYTLCPKITLDGLVDQVRAACAWIWRNARAYGGDPSRLHVCGHSAGGHLTAMMSATDWPGFHDGLPPDMIRSAIPIGGLFDLEPLRLSSVNDAMSLDIEAARRNSPHFMTPATDLPMSVVVGGEETDEFRRQSRDFAAAWRDSTRAMEYIETPGHHHFAAIEAMTEADNALTATILRHLNLPT